MQGHQDQPHTETQNIEESFRDLQHRLTQFDIEALRTTKRNNAFNRFKFPQLYEMMLQHYDNEEDLNKISKGFLSDRLEYVIYNIKFGMYDQFLRKFLFYSCYDDSTAIHWRRNEYLKYISETLRLGDLRDETIKKIIYFIRRYIKLDRNHLNNRAKDDMFGYINDDLDFVVV